MRRIQVKQLPYDLTPVAGLALVGHCLEALDASWRRLDAALPVRARVRSIRDDYGRFGAWLEGFAEHLQARDLRDFVVERSRSTGWAATKTCTTARRMFLRFLVAEGRCSPHCWCCPPRWRTGGSLPCPDACRRSTSSA
jgi:hypothetical protein